MSLIINVIAAIVALLHVYILVLEMFLWDKPYGRKAFGLTSDAVRHTKVLAANQGLYNGFLAAGLIWGIILGQDGINIVSFFLCCIMIAGIFGAFTANRKILFIQALPAALGLLLILFY